MIQFSTRMDQLKGSEIRELLKLTARPDIISFAGGLPAPELFPVEEVEVASKTVLEEKTLENRALKAYIKDWSETES